MLYNFVIFYYEKLILSLMVLIFDLKDLSSCLFARTFVLGEKKILIEMGFNMLCIQIVNTITLSLKQSIISEILLILRLFEFYNHFLIFQSQITT